MLWILGPARLSSHRIFQMCLWWEDRIKFLIADSLLSTCAQVAWIWYLWRREWDRRPSWNYQVWAGACSRCKCWPWHSSESAAAYQGHVSRVVICWFLLSKTSSTDFPTLILQRYMNRLNNDNAIFHWWAIYSAALSPLNSIVMQLAGCVAVEVTGGPTIPFHPGRKV